MSSRKNRSPEMGHYEEVVFGSGDFSQIAL